MQVFSGDDTGYLRWLAANPDGFVVNAYRRPTAGYLVLHRAGCRTISRETAREGCWTDRYTKICATELPELQQFAQAQGAATFTKVCSICRR